MTQSEEPYSKKGNKQVVECPLGNIEYDEEGALFFPEGLYGYDQYNRFLIWSQEKFFPFEWLVCLEEPTLIFPVIDPMVVISDYNPRGIDGESSNTIRVIVTMGSSVETVTANLRAPIIISREKNQAKQVILTDSLYPLRYPVIKQPN